MCDFIIIIALASYLERLVIVKAAVLFCHSCAGIHGCRTQKGKQKQKEEKDEHKEENKQVEDEEEEGEEEGEEEEKRKGERRIVSQKFHGLIHTFTVNSQTRFLSGRPCR